MILPVERYEVPPFWKEPDRERVMMVSGSDRFQILDHEIPLKPSRNYLIIKNRGLVSSGY